MATENPMVVIFKVATGRTEGTVRRIQAMDMTASGEKTMYKFEVEMKAMGIASTERSEDGPVNQRRMRP